MKLFYKFLLLSASVLSLSSVSAAEYNSKPEISGELKMWHKVTFTFDGPECSETMDELNPFMDYRFNVTFTHTASGESFLVPGYFAADGNAGETSATSGNKWRVHFAPNATGEWTYCVNFRKGIFVAVSDRVDTFNSGEYMDNATGSFVVGESDKTGRDFRGKGFLTYNGERYLRFTGSGEYFLKAGPDSPENFLSFKDFDGTFHNDGQSDHLVKEWAAHAQHWREGDPTWKDGKGKNIIGAINYLASKEMNSFSFVSMNVNGDDRNVFPYVDYNTLDRMDCSKLDQWEVIFSHADVMGMFMHIKLLEFENQGLLDGGGVGAKTKLYFREMIARFGHHLALNWNICEETGDWDKFLACPVQDTWNKLSCAGYFAKHDPYKHHIVIHNGEEFDDILGANSPFTGVALQTWDKEFRYVHSRVKQWIDLSKAAGKQWAVACDEPGHWQVGLVPDADDADHDVARKNGLWGALMAGAWGTEWYFGYDYAHFDLNCEDYASRDLFWDQCRIANDFFWDNEIPFWSMDSHDELVHNDDDYGFAKLGEVYVFYFKNGTAKVDLSTLPKKSKVMWYNPRKGGEMQVGSKRRVAPGAEVDLGVAPTDKDKDWVVVVR